MNKELALFFLILVISLTLIGCSDPTSSELDLPIEVLLSAPESITVKGITIILDTEVGLDLMPIVEPNPMIVFAFVQTADSSLIPDKIYPHSVYVIKDNEEIWKSEFTHEDRPDEEQSPHKIIAVARKGPYWGPDILVDVVVKLEFNGKSFLLKASDQNISATY